METNIRCYKTQIVFGTKYKKQIYSPNFEKEYLHILGIWTEDGNSNISITNEFIV